MDRCSCMALGALESVGLAEALVSTLHLQNLLPSIRQPHLLSQPTAPTCVPLAFVPTHCPTRRPHLFAPPCSFELPQSVSPSPILPPFRLSMVLQELWLAAVRSERKAGNEKAAETTLAKALQVGAWVCVGGRWSQCTGGSWSGPHAPF